MDIKIKETGKIKELGHRVNGQDMAGEMVGQNEPTLERDDDGYAILNQDAYDWWVTYMHEHAETERMIAEYRERYGSVAVEAVIHSNHMAVEFNDWPQAARAALQEAFSARRAAAIMGSRTSERKASAVRINGRKGGRPRKQQ